MRSVIKKAYWNYEKEENWLNEMSAKGFALIDYCWIRYVFEDSAPGEFIYRIELLERHHAHPESKRYIEFMEESGAEHIASYIKWVYFRKKASEGAFDIYSDVESRIKFYKRIYKFYLTCTIAEFCAGLMNVLYGFHPPYYDGILYFNAIAGLFVVFLGFLFIYLCVKMRKKITELEKQKIISE